MVKVGAAVWAAATLFVWHPCFAQLVHPGITTTPAGYVVEDPLQSASHRPVDLLQTQAPSPGWMALTEIDPLRKAATEDRGWSPQTSMYLVMLLRKAAEQNDAEALYELGALSFAGKGMPRSAIDGFNYCKQAAELGYSRAYYQLAALYAMGHGTAVDEEQALYWGRKAVAEGNPKAKYSIGRLLLLRGKPQEIDEAVSLLEQASAKGIAEAAVLLAGAYAKGANGLDKDPAKARLLLQPHAESNAEARNALADLSVSE